MGQQDMENTDMNSGDQDSEDSAPSPTHTHKHDAVKAKLDALEMAIAKAREDLLNQIANADVSNVIDKTTLDA